MPIVAVYCSATVVVRTHGPAWFYYLVWFGERGSTGRRGGATDDYIARIAWRSIHGLADRVLRTVRSPSWLGVFTRGGPARRFDHVAGRHARDWQALTAEV